MKSRLRTFQLASLVLLPNLLWAATAHADGFSSRFNRWLLGEEANAAIPGVEETGVNVLEPAGPMLDSASMTCLGCHNGSRATSIAVKRAEDPWQFSSLGTQVNHPVGMDYDDFSRDARSRLRPRNMLDPRIALHNGRVTCMSCHQLRETRAFYGRSTEFGAAVETAPVGPDDCSASSRLTIEVGESSLCQACHSV